MKSQIMRKLFIGNLLIFAFLLVLQYSFQTILFESFLTRSQNSRLLKSVNSIQSYITKEDEEEVRHRITEAADRGIVIVAVDQEMNQVYGKRFDAYQRCFTVENERGQQYSIVEDYLESVSLQTIQEGDVVSIEGYLVDERNALVIPSKVYRMKDGLVLGTDTFLFINQADAPEEDESADQTTTESGVVVSSQPGIAVNGDTIDTNTKEGTIVSQGQAIADEDSDQTQQTTGITQSQGTPDENNVLSEGVTEQEAGAEGAAQNEKNLPQGFVLQAPIGTSSSNSQSEWSGAPLAGDTQNTTLRDKRILIINSLDRDADSYPVTVNGTVIDLVDLSNDDLLVQQGLITDEINRLSATADKATFDNAYTITNQLTTGKYLLCVSRLAESGLTVIGAISLYSIQDMNHMMNTFHAWLFLVELGLITGAIYFFSRMISKPLIQMNGVALKIAQQDFSSRVNVTTDDEIGMVGASINEISINLEQRIHQINQMNDHLRRDYERQLELQERQKQLSATFSHEMKTPLTILRGYIDSMQSGLYPMNQVEYYAIALRELDNTSKLITQMLEIARMESPYFMPKKRSIDLWMVFFKVYDELKQTLDSKEMHVEFAADDEANAFADAELLERVISNALTNAMKYSPKGSRISVCIATAAERHTFTMENENAHIPEDELEKVWQPFYRGEKTQAKNESGTGLGLMIVGEILDAHGFAYGIMNTDRGVAFRFSCPAIAPLAEQESYS